MARTRRGAKRGTPSSDRAAIADLEAQIARLPGPGAGDVHLVLADALSRLGDPRGELIVVQHRLRACPDDAALRQREADLLERHARKLVGPIPPDCTWQLGFVHRARLDLADTEGDGARLRDVLDHPSARFLAELELHVTCHESESNAGHVIAALAARPRPGLRSLTLIAPGSSSTADDMLSYGECRHRAEDDRLWRQLPDLRRLHLGGINLFHAVELPQLEELILDDAPLCDAGRWSLPALRRLDWMIYWHTAGLSLDCSLDVIDPLWRQQLPALRELWLRGSFVPDDTSLFARAEVRSFLRSLDRLDLSSSAASGFHGPDLVECLRQNAEALRHLSKLVVMDVDPDPGVAEELRAVLPNVVLDPDRDWLRRL